MEEQLYTLKLDAAWKPIDIISASRGFIMAWTGRAKTVKSYEMGPLEDEKYPAVIVLDSYISKRRLTLPCNRKNVFWRDDYTCQYCTKKFSYGKLTMDHVIPKSKNGSTNWENVVTSCKSCNSAKGSTLQKPIREPFKPSFSHLLNGHKIDENTFPDSEWAKYIF